MEHSVDDAVHKIPHKVKTLVLWSTQRWSTFLSTQRISQHVDIIFNILTKEQ